jgi:hypothetical protein
MQTGQQPNHDTRNIKTGFSRVVIIVLLAEKVIQHIVVTVAFYLDLKGIASTVVIDSRILMVAGALLAILFALSLWGMLSQRGWAVNLAILLAACDILGEFIAQGRLDIVITVSFVVATILFFFAIGYRRAVHRQLAG